MIMVNWSYIVTCNNCGYISNEKLSKEMAKKLSLTHLDRDRNCTRGHIKLMKVRT